MDRRQNFLRYFDDIDAAGLRQRSLFLRYFEDFKAAGLDPVAVMDLAFSGASGVFLCRMVAGMKLFRDRCRPPREFFWALEDAPPRTRDQIFKLLNWDDPAGLAAELDGIVSRERTKAAKFWHTQKTRAIETVDELLVPALRAIAAGETPKSLPGIPGKTIAAVLSTYIEKRKRGPLPFREIAVAILLRNEGSEEDPLARLHALDAARKEKLRAPRKPRRAKSATHSS